MLRRFRIKSVSIKEQDKFAVLSYDTDKDEYAISIPRDINTKWLPAIPMLLFQKGIYELDDKFARRFVKERVIPADRQNIGDILRKIGVPYYSEFAILEYCSGRCCMDDFYLDEIKDDSPGEW